MADHPGGVRVVDDIEAEAARIGRIQAERRGNQPIRIPTDPPKPQAEVEISTGLVAALGREVYTWTSPWNPAVVVRFRRPRAGTDELVARMLGDQSDNTALVRRYKALLAIIEVNGEKITTDRMTDTKLRLLRDRVAFVGPDDEDVFDEALGAYVMAYEMAMYPQQITAISEAQGLGLSADDIARIAKNAGLERPKP